MSSISKVFFDILFFVFLVNKINGAHFGYKHPDEWSIDYPDCGGSRQSPINVNADEMVSLEVSSNLQWKGYDVVPQNMSLEGNGHSVQLSATWADNKDPCISGGVLDAEYTFAQLHFHWGPQNDVGSEHTFNNDSYPLEMHMVHYKKEYGSTAEALKHEDGLAVVGFLFKIGNKDNKGIMNLQLDKNVGKLQNSKVEIEPFPLDKFEISFQKDYATYLGSLTTPPCSEIVTWILASLPQLVTNEQMDSFRSIELTDGDDHNYRPTMPLNGRTINYIGS